LQINRNNKFFRHLIGNIKKKKLHIMWNKCELLLTTDLLYKILLRNYANDLQVISSKIIKINVILKILIPRISAHLDFCHNLHYFVLKAHTDFSHEIIIRGLIRGHVIKRLNQFISCKYLRAFYFRKFWRFFKIHKRPRLQLFFPKRLTQKFWIILYFKKVVFIKTTPWHQFWGIWPVIRKNSNACQK
jgi:hypothetical protein